MATATRADLRLRAKRKADQENSQFVSDPEWNDLLDEGVAELHEIVTGKHDDYLVKPSTVTLVANQASYDLPSDFLRVRGVDLVSGSVSYTLRPFMFRERNRLQGIDGSVQTDFSYSYQIVGGQLKLIPTPNAGSDTLTLWYVPEAQKFTSDADTLSAEYAQGWDRYPVLYAAIQAKLKQEDDVAAEMMQLMALRKQIEAQATTNSADPKRIVDVRYQRESWI